MNEKGRVEIKNDKARAQERGEGQVTDPVQARARGPIPEVWATFCQRVSEGRTERIAAMGLGVPYTTIRSWMDHHPELREQLLDARAVEIQRRLDRMEETPLSIGSGGTDEDAAAGGIHPKAAELLMKHDRWRLETLDPVQFMPAKKLDQTVSGPDGGAVQSEVRITLAEARDLAKDDE